jgi:sterol desaturase/sphingolipid hydroxylase (fatty acid hydroxylase superfamily)
LFIIAYSFVGFFDIFTHHTSYYFENKILNSIFGGSKFHHTHHSKYKFNYGLNNGIFDRLHKTLKI